ncbi:38556_t:CDS:1, partial [Gigaspora margarita]
WHHAPQQRITLTNLHIILEELAENYQLLSCESHIESMDSKFIRTETTGNKDPSIDFGMPLEKGIKLHRMKDYENAWKCFEENADLGNPEAKFWQGYYLYYGLGVEIDKERAKELYKEAADNDIADAQVRYSVLLLSNLKKDDNEATKEEICSKILHYLKLAANNKHVDALYYLGDIYVHGKLKVQKNKDLGLEYLRFAANENHSKAINLLKNL